MFNDAPDGRRPNLSPEFLKLCKDRLGLDFVADANGDLETTFGPEDMLHYAYAVLQSRTYRSRYEELLKIDFPRLPVTDDTALFRKLCEHGKRLVDLHLMNWAPDPSEKPSFPESGSDSIIARYPRYFPPGEDAPNGESVEEGRVYINESQYFRGVEPEVWEFHLGGYQICRKWLKDRKGGSIDAYSEKVHYKNIIATARETIRQLERVDSVIEESGGWPLGRPQVGTAVPADSQ